MGTDVFSIKGLSDKIGSIAKDVRSVLKAETGEDHDEAVIRDSIRHIVANKIEIIADDLLEMFTSPGRPEFHELARLSGQKAVDVRAAAIEESVGLAQEFGDDSLFTGKRAFSKAKMAAMIEYLTARGHYVYKTSLNKLLFYADMTNFYLAGHGMSGAVYYNRRFGPVADPAAPILTELINEQKVKFEPRTRSLEAVDNADTEVLTVEEQKVLDWVAATYGPMSAGEVSEFSHNEMAYKYTEPNEPIAYAYAQFFKKLHPKNLLGN